MKELLMKRAKTILLSGAIVLSSIGTYHVLDTEAITAPKYSILIEKGGGVEFYSDVSRESAQEVVRYLEETDRKNKAAILSIYSYGGSASDMSSILVAMEKRKNKTVTIVQEIAYSAGALMFMQGDERYIDRFARIGLHGGRLGDATGNEMSVRQQYYTLLSDEFKDTLATGKPADTLTAEEKFLHIKLLSEVAMNGYPATVETKKARHDLIIAGNELVAKRIAEKIGWSIEKTKKVLFDDFRTDVILSGQQLIDMGLAKDLRELKQ